MVELGSLAPRTPPGEDLGPFPKAELLLKLFRRVKYGDQCLVPTLMSTFLYDDFDDGFQGSFSIIGLNISTNSNPNSTSPIAISPLQIAFARRRIQYNFIGHISKPIKNQSIARHPRKQHPKQNYPFDKKSTKKHPNRSRSTMHNRVGTTSIRDFTMTWHNLSNLDFHQRIRKEINE